jgi:hypothetical protein
MKKIREFKKEIVVNCSKAEVWDVLFNRFDEVNSFNPLIDGSHHTKGEKGAVGCERQCDLDSKHSIHERIIAARDNEGFDIDIIRGGLPMMDEMKGSYLLEALADEKTRVTFTVRYNTKPSFMAVIIQGMMAKMFFKMLIGLKYHLETKKLVTKSNIKSIVKAYGRLPYQANFKLDTRIAA